MTIQDAIDLLRGTPGTHVKVSMGREGVKDEIELTSPARSSRSKACLTPACSTRTLLSRLADFSQRPGQLDAALDSLTRKCHATKLIFDCAQTAAACCRKGTRCRAVLPPGDTTVTHPPARLRLHTTFFVARTRKVAFLSP